MGKSRKILAKGTRFMGAIMGVTLGLSIPLTSSATELKVWVQNSADRAFESSRLPKNAQTDINLYAARNEYEAAQILTRSSEALTNVHVTYSELIGSSGQVLSKDNITVRREFSHVNVKQYGAMEIPEDGSKNYTDALVENSPYSLQGNKTLAYWYSVYIPKDQEPGLYQGTAIVNSDQGSFSVNVSVDVYDVTLPDTANANIKMNNWFGSAGWDYAGTEQSITAQYNCVQYDDNWWTVMENIARNHKKHRNNVVYADFTALLLPNTSIDENGTYHFGWETFDRFIQLFIDEGGAQYIYTPHLLETGQGKLEMIKKDGNGNVIKKLVHTNTNESNQYMDILIPALKAHLDEKGWTDMFYIAANDEPGTQDQATAANWFYDKVYEHFPQAKSCEAHNGQYQTPRVEDKLTDVAPLLNVYDSNKAYYDQLKANGTDIWLYTCIGPQGDYLNRFVSYHLSRTRLLQWYVMKIGGSGYLHWGWNYWADTADTFDLSTNNDPFSGGDKWLVYPDKSNYDVYDSVRSEAQLDGIEDYELLYMLNQQDASAANNIIESLISTGTRYSTSGTKITHAHKTILDLLTGRTPSELPTIAPSEFETLERINAVASSTVTSSWSPSKAIDDLKNVGKGWGDNGWSSNRQNSATGEESISIELDEMATIKEVRLIPRTWNDSVYSFPRNFKIQYSVDGVNYLDIPGQSYENYLNPVDNQGEIFILDSPVTGKYLRVVGTVFRKDNGGNYYMQLAEVEIYGQSGVSTSTNLAQGKVVTTSSSAENWGWLKANLVDGEVNSLPNQMGWTSWDQTDNPDHEEWVAIDLGETKQIERLELYPRNDAGQVGVCFPEEFSIQVSQDNLTWQVVVDENNYDQPTGPIVYDLSNLQGRYVKISGAKLRADNHGMYLMQLAEVKVIGQ